MDPALLSELREHAVNSGSSDEEEEDVSSSEAYSNSAQDSEDDDDSENADSHSNSDSSGGGGSNGTRKHFSAANSYDDDEAPGIIENDDGTMTLEASPSRLRLENFPSQGPGGEKGLRDGGDQDQKGGGDGDVENGTVDTDVFTSSRRCRRHRRLHVGVCQVMGQTTAGMRENKAAETEVCEADRRGLHYPITL